MDQKKIGSFLKELRKEKDITQEQLAEKINVSGRTVSRWETGSNMPDISLLAELAEFYDVSIPEIIDGEEEYQKIIECELSVAKQVVPIVVAVPKNWQRTLIDIYIAQHMTFPFIPHVDIKGKICLFETEGILIDQNLCGIILQSIERAKEIIEDGLAGTNREDFVEEFESYWLQLPSIRFAKVDVVGIQHISIVKYFTKTTKRYKKESYAKYMQRAKTGKIYVSNQYVMSNKLMVPVVYAWNEVLGLGNHVAYIEYGNAGCYECFIGRDEDTGELYDRTAYCRSGQKVVQKVTGCGSSFIPYGSTISLKTAGMCVDTIKKIFEGRYSDNVIISAKGDDYHFKRSGLQVSNKYLNQKDSIVECSGKLFAQPKCQFCGEKYGN